MGGYSLDIFSNQEIKLNWDFHKILMKLCGELTMQV